MVLDLPDREFGGYIFDCDGTLVDSMPLHYRAWLASFAHHGAPWQWSEEEFYQTAGVPEHVTTRRLNAEHGADLDPDAVHDWKRDWYFQHLDELQPVAAVAELARRFHSQSLPISVASGSERSIVETSLEITGLRGLFDIIVTPELVRHGKPAPDMFLLAAEKMRVAPESCLVFEDGQAGIDAANAAGMASVFVPSRG